MAKLVHRHHVKRRRPLSAEALSILARLGRLQRERAASSVPVDALALPASQRAWGALEALYRRSLVAKATSGGLRLTSAGWALLRGVN